MTTDIVNEVANKIGVAAENIIPGLVQLKIRDGIFLCIIYALAILYFVYEIYKIHNNVKNNIIDDTDAIIVGICVIAIGFFLILAILEAYDLVNWITLPQTKVIEYILNRLG